MPTVLPPSGNPLVFLDITLNAQPLTRLPLELYPTPSSTPFHAQCVSAPPGYKNSRITRILPGVGVYGGSDAAAPAHAPQQFQGAGEGRVLEWGELAWANPGGAGGGGGNGGNGYVISLGGARGEAIGRVFGEGGVEGLRMLAATGVGRRGRGCRIWRSGLRCVGSFRRGRVVRKRGGLGGGGILGKGEGGRGLCFEEY